MTKQYYSINDVQAVIQKETDVTISDIQKEHITLTHNPFDVELAIHFNENRPTISIVSLCRLFGALMGGKGVPLYNEHKQWVMVQLLETN